MSPRSARRAFGAFACALALSASTSALAAAGGPTLPAGARPQDVDRLAAEIQKSFGLTGFSVAIVQDGQVALTKGYGVRAAGKPEKVDENTLFAIGSNTKAFTTAALAILVDEGKLKWDDKVIDHLPAFRLYDPYVTRELTIRDILTHRSGLGLGSGDLMLFPSTDFKRSEIIHNLRYFEPASSFRSKYAYDNLLYIVAGELIPAVTGQSWEDFVQTRILDKLGTGCAPTYVMIRDRGNVAQPHVRAGGKVQQLAPDESTAYDPAGAIQCNARGMAAWASTQLAQGKLPGGAQLFSAARSREMWTPQTITPGLPDSAKMTGTHFRSYGLGWGLEDYHGSVRASHTGAVIGMTSYVSLLPEQKSGVIILTNEDRGAGLSAMMQTLLDAMMGQPKQDWIGYWKGKLDQADAATAEADREAEAAIKASGGRAFLPLDAYVGAYHDVWRGDATVTKVGDRLRLTFSRTTGMAGDMQVLKGNVFVVRWDDRTLKADAKVNFKTGMDGEISGMTMAPLSPSTDFSFDFQDLDFTKKPVAKK